MNCLSRLGQIATCLTLLVNPVRADVTSGYPQAVFCTIPEGVVVGYLHHVNKDGGAIYMSMTGQHAKVTPDGVLHRQGLNDCDGVTIQQLRAKGQTREFAKQP